MIRAEVDHGYFRKFLFVFLGCMAFAGWCLYDALIKYPRALEIAEAYEKIDESVRREQWPILTKEKGWPKATPQKSAEKISQGIGQQYFMLIICLAMGIPAVLKWMSGQGTWVEGDEATIRNSHGKTVPIDSITKIDKRKWSEKGIAKIHFQDGSSKKTFVMDDFKYERAAMSQIMAMAEANLSDDQIIGGQRESATEADETLPSEPETESEST
ncbi:hypothetical protein [Stieleria varia]|uniref:Uncharacterized protein n=1 Tax=Stieleria varia TaxID=2528005 RepID=A0A5C6A1Q1_9BACT|nr:hypothetical protein [Stieleria varia]TWT93782.1 hypothetical protein Pla52n_56100 [Stieleria varia]